MFARWCCRCLKSERISAIRMARASFTEAMHVRREGSELVVNVGTRDILHPSVIEQGKDWFSCGEKMGLDGQ